MIEIQNLTKRYDANTVVDNVSLTVDTGQIAALVGTSGSGKTTLLRMINRLVEPSGGRVLIDGQDTVAIEPYLLRRRIGYAIQGHGLFPHRTVAQNIATVPRLLNWPEPEVRARVDEEPFRFVRLCPMEATRPLQAGPYLCAPTRSGFSLRFHRWSLTEPDASLH